MKKIIFSLLAVCLIGPVASFGQEEDKQQPVDSAKRNYHYLVKITAQSGEKIKGVLSRFSYDSVFLINYDDKFIFMVGALKIVSNNEEMGVAAENIKTLFIRKDNTIIDRDTLDKYKSGIIKKNIVLGILSLGVDAAVSSIPIGGSGGLQALSTLNTAAIIMTSAAVVTGTLVLASRGKKFILNGNKEKFEEMILILTGIKKDNSENDETESD